MGSASPQGNPPSLIFKTSRSHIQNRPLGVKTGQYQKGPRRWKGASTQYPIGTKRNFRTFPKRGRLPKGRSLAALMSAVGLGRVKTPRSEEHTSELQSLR